MLPRYKVTVKYNRRIIKLKIFDWGIASPTLKGLTKNYGKTTMTNNSQSWQLNSRPNRKDGFNYAPKNKGTLKYDGINILSKVFDGDNSTSTLKGLKNN